VYWTLNVTAKMNLDAGESICGGYPTATGIDSAGHDIGSAFFLAYVPANNDYEGSSNLTTQPAHVRVASQFITAVMTQVD
jgi:hypothetical protein